MTDRTERHLWAAEVEYADGEKELFTLEEYVSDVVAVTKTRDDLLAIISGERHCWSCKKITPFKFYPSLFPPYGAP